MMLTRLLRVVLPVTLAAAFGLQPARADIYTWVDASGSINVSNLAPPEGARVTSIIHASAQATTAEQTAREAQALAQRVRQLESDAEQARRDLPPPADYRPASVPQIVQYIVEPAPVVQYVSVVNESAPGPAYAGCDPAGFNCGLAWAPGFYSVNVIQLRSPPFRHVQPAPGERDFRPRPPMHASLVPPLSLPLVPPLLPPPLRPFDGFHRG